MLDRTLLLSFFPLLILCTTNDLRPTTAASLRTGSFSHTSNCSTFLPGANLPSFIVTYISFPCAIVLLDYCHCCHSSPSGTVFFALLHSIPIVYWQDHRGWLPESASLYLHCSIVHLQTSLCRTFASGFHRHLSPTNTYNLPLISTPHQLQQLTHNSFQTNKLKPNQIKPQKTPPKNIPRSTCLPSKTSSRLLPLLLSPAQPMGIW